MASLKSIYVLQPSLTHFERVDVDRPVFVAVLNVLPLRLPALLIIEIGFNLQLVRSHTELKYRLQVFLSQVYHPSLLDFLAQKCESGETLVRFVIDVTCSFAKDGALDVTDELKAQCRVSIEQMFSELTRIKRCVLEIQL